MYLTWYQLLDFHHPFLHPHHQRFHLNSLFSLSFAISICDVNWFDSLLRLIPRLIDLFQRIIQTPQSTLRSFRAMEADFRGRCITLIEQTLWSPNISPVENFQDFMKDYKQFYHSRLYEEKQMRHDELWKNVKAAWNDTTKLEKLIKGLHIRCEAVVHTNGGPNQ